MPNRRHSLSLDLPDSPGRPSSPKSSSSTSPLPTQTYHSPILPGTIPLPALFESAASGAHYTGVKIDDGSTRRRRSSSYHHTELNHDHHRVLDDLTELYCCRPTLEIFERSWNKDAEFEAPQCKCKGYKEYTAQWFAMPKLFSRSEQLSKRVMSSTDSPNRLVYFQRQEYTFRLLNKKKVIESIIVVDLDENDRILRLVDQWNGGDLPTHFGLSLLRTLCAKVVPWIIHAPHA